MYLVKDFVALLINLLSSISLRFAIYYLMLIARYILHGTLSSSRCVLHQDLHIKNRFAIDCDCTVLDFAPAGYIRKRPFSRIHSYGCVSLASMVFIPGGISILQCFA